MRVLLFNSPCRLVSVDIMQKHPRYKALVVTKDSETRTLLDRVLSTTPVSVELVEPTTGENETDVFFANEVDLLFLENNASEFNPFELLKNIRHKRSLTELPIILITNQITESEQLQSFQAGANDYILKTINPLLLQARVTTQLSMIDSTRILVNAKKRFAEKLFAESLGIFSAGIAHNFNNLLGAVLGNVELLKLIGPNTPETFRALDLIQKAATSGVHLTRNLLRLVDVEEDDTCSNIHEIVHSAIALIQAACGLRIAFSTKIPATLPPLYISPKNLSIVLLELLRNAVESIKQEGKITIEAETKNDETGKPYVSLFVKDSGCGIPPELIDRISVPFCLSKGFHADIGLSFNGEGFGLSTAYNIVHEINGTLRVLSSNGAGTTLEVKLPAALSPFPN